MHIPSEMIERCAVHVADLDRLLAANLGAKETGVLSSSKLSAVCSFFIILVITQKLTTSNLLILSFSYTFGQNQKNALTDVYILL